MGNFGNRAAVNPLVATVRPKSPKLIFISCGQRDGETELGQALASRINATPGFRAFFAQEQGEARGLNEHIFDNLARCAGAVIIMHRRGKVVESKDGKTEEFFRSSVFINQEVAILHYRNHKENLRIPVLAFVEDGVKSEGVVEFSILNPKKLPQKPALMKKVKAWLLKTTFPGHDLLGEDEPTQESEFPSPVARYMDDQIQKRSIDRMFEKPAKPPAKTPLQAFQGWLDLKIALVRNIRNQATDATISGDVDKVVAWEKEVMIGLRIAFGSDTDKIGEFKRRDYHMFSGKNTLEIFMFRGLERDPGASKGFVAAIDEYIAYMEYLRNNTIPDEFAPTYKPEDLLPSE